MMERYIQILNPNENTMIVMEEIETEIEAQKLTSRITELETLNQKLVSTLREGVEIEPEIFDERIQELQVRFAQLENDKRTLEFRLNQSNQQYAALVEKLAEDVRRVSLQSTELEGQVRAISAKIPLIEDLNKRQERTIENIKFRYNDTSYDKIKDMEERILKLQNTNVHLERYLIEMKSAHVALTNDLEDKIRESIAFESKQLVKITKLKKKIKEVDRENNTLQNQLEHMKLLEGEVLKTETEKNNKLTADLHNFCAKNTSMRKEKTALETENAELKQELQTLKMEFHDLGALN